jgi:hypothetical protein
MFKGNEGIKTLKYIEKNIPQSDTLLDPWNIGMKNWCVLKILYESSDYIY